MVNNAMINLSFIITKLQVTYKCKYYNVSCSIIERKMQCSFIFENKLLTKVLMDKKNNFKIKLFKLGIQFKLSQSCKSMFQSRCGFYKDIKPCTYFVGLLLQWWLWFNIATLSYYVVNCTYPLKIKTIVLRILFCSLTCYNYNFFSYS